MILVEKVSIHPYDSSTVFLVWFNREKQSSQIGRMVTPRKADAQNSKKHVEGRKRSVVHKVIARVNKYTIIKAI